MAFYPDKSCYGGKGVQTSKSGFGGFFGSTKSISIGMTESTGSHTYSCEKTDGSFIPENGKDYKVTFNYNNTTCEIKVNRVETAEAEISLLPVKTAMPGKCSARD